MTTLGDAVDHMADTRGSEIKDERIPFLSNFIAGLDPLNRALILLYLEEHTHREIAAILGISETNVATKISRLRCRVRERYAQTLEEESPHGTR